jgi:hypothetical protein
MPARSDPGAERRSLVLVAGSGRSGTSLFTGILQRLGFHVPRPEVPADSTNPKGFAESQWVVDFHTAALRRAGVHVSDARPTAWAHMAQVVVEDEMVEKLRRWLDSQFKEADHLIIKDPRLSWFLPLWTRSAEDFGVTPRLATVLRHPAAVVESKQRSYGGWESEVGRTAGWLNQALFTERATREAVRVFVRYEDILDDWTTSVARVGQELGLKVIQDAPAASIVRVHDFVDRNLSRSRATWEDFEIPVALREQVDEVWELVSQLADVGVNTEEVHPRLDAARAAYISFYEDAEAIAQSSIVAAGRRRGRAAHQSSFLVRASARVPKRYRAKVPLRWRRAVFRALNRSRPARV